jgi:hypothetical protein
MGPSHPRLVPWPVPHRPAAVHGAVAPLHGVARAARPLLQARSNGYKRFHLHLHGVSAEDVAAIIGQQQPAARPAIEEDCQRFACRVYREGYRDG